MTPPKRFTPQLVETSTTSSRRRNRATSTAQAEQPTSSRRFAPQLVETTTSSSRRSRRRREPNDAGHVQFAARPLPLEIPPNLRRDVSPLDGSPRRQHSFRCPDLDTIESSESEPSTSPAATTATATVLDHRRLSAAARRLRDQALSAFPNSDFHEPVEHYALSSDQEDDDDAADLDEPPYTREGHDDILAEMARRRESTVKLRLEKEELSQFVEELERERAAARLTAANRKARDHKPTWWAATRRTARHSRMDSDVELRNRPPLLGKSLDFPRCKSPDSVRAVALTDNVPGAETDGLWNRPTKPADKKTGLWGGHCIESSPPKSGLWNGLCGEQSTNPPAVLWNNHCTTSPPSSPPNSLTSGLWNGLCASSPTPRAITPFQTKKLQTGLLTPHTQSRASSPVRDAPPTNTERLLDEIMLAEFPDSFVTQVYNYLALGYPALARDYDYELEKITAVPVAELRSRDKEVGRSRGYIPFGEDFEREQSRDALHPSGDEMPPRWRALKLYIREWARQEKNMVGEESPWKQWATAARRGSWGI
ncbi:hypothetical protein K470DRAFT_259192 [Piedraia hortae CBS 480.64]|uniref:Uncharacterized protein n=1 Tax=Piedraia hortae CBS 480.64 TaxID=1314780 RepID=A0A6A7BVA3_9PEZI|nr:hypothetical protein K470DRAFT_259192 [Piedraia hortae CBS 480.64]